MKKIACLLLAFLFAGEHHILAQNKKEKKEKVTTLKLIQKGESAEKVLEALSSALTNKFLHAPSHALNQAHGDEHTKLEDIIKQIYQIKH